VKLEGNKEAQQLLQTTMTSIQNWLLPYPHSLQQQKSSEQNISYQPCSVSVSLWTTKPFLSHVFLWSWTSGRGWPHARSHT